MNYIFFMIIKILEARRSTSWNDIHIDLVVLFVCNEFFLLWIWWNGRQSIECVWWKTVPMWLVCIFDWCPKIAGDIYDKHTTINGFSRLWEYRMYSRFFQKGNLNFRWWALSIKLKIDNIWIPFFACFFIHLRRSTVDFPTSWHFKELLHRFQIWIESDDRKSRQDSSLFAQPSLLHIWFAPRV